MSDWRTFKIIGGNRNGERVGLYPGQATVAIHDSQQPLLCNPYEPDKIPKSISISSTTYTLRRLNGPDGKKIEWLSPETMTDWEAIERMFLYG